MIILFPELKFFIVSIIFSSEAEKIQHPLSSTFRRVFLDNAMICLLVYFFISRTNIFNFISIATEYQMNMISHNGPRMKNQSFIILSIL